MISSWRKIKRATKIRRKPTIPPTEQTELEIPIHFRCPITLDLIKDPVTLPTGITYDRESIELWLETSRTCPVTNQAFGTDPIDLIPNRSITRIIQDWCVENRSHGFERIPTPRNPITESDVSKILREIVAKSQHANLPSFVKLISKLKSLGKESERNRKCIAENGACGVLSAAFERLSSSPHGNNDLVFDEILSSLTVFFPLDGIASSYLESKTSLRCLIRLLTSEHDLSRRRNSALVLNGFVDSNPRNASEVAGMEGSLEALCKLIQEPVCPATTKASLAILFCMVSSSEEVIPRLAQLGIVGLLLGFLVDNSQRGPRERALGLLDRLCSHERGRVEARDHMLTVPIVVKKMVRVSVLATEFTVSILWKLSKSDERECVFEEAIQVGAFQKLLVILQVGCRQGTKEKATELLKVLNGLMDTVMCVDAMEYFKYIEKTY